MNFRFLRRKTLFILILIIFIIGLFFYWKEYKKEDNEKTIEDLADYIVEETPDGKIITTKDGSLTFKVPQGWFLRKEGKYLATPVWIMSPELYKNYIEEQEENIFNSKEGCLISLGIEKEISDLEKLKEEIRKGAESFELEGEIDFENVELKSYNSLKTSFVSSMLGYNQGLLVLTDNKIQGFEVYSGEDYKEKCLDEFNKFVEQISFNK
ncbi:MAG: hypothetical protein PHI53_01585 [Candidatus Pacebacteria bacterium]|nr:hypothetical protein [Candidatus Paceibacterota bacterium]